MSHHVLHSPLGSGGRDPLQLLGAGGPHHFCDAGSGFRVKGSSAGHGLHCMTSTGAGAGWRPAWTAIDTPRPLHVRLRPTMAAAGFGALLALAVPPWGLWVLAPVGYAGLYRLSAGRSTKQRFWIGFAAGFVLYAATLWWMTEFHPAAIA